jgi:hypothetical protein
MLSQAFSQAPVAFPDTLIGRKYDSETQFGGTRARQAVG